MRPRGEPGFQDGCQVLWAVSPDLLYLAIPHLELNRMQTAHIVEPTPPQPPDSQPVPYLFRDQGNLATRLRRMWGAGQVRKTRQKDDQRVVKISSNPRTRCGLQTSSRSA